LRKSKLRKLSNVYCHPGRAGGSPFFIRLILGGFWFVAPLVMLFLFVAFPPRSRPPEATMLTDAPASGKGWHNLPCLRASRLAGSNESQLAGEIDRKVNASSGSDTIQK
jgi:hypothetical protein